MMEENKVKRILFLHSRDDLLREITACTQNATKITLHCSNFKEIDSKYLIRTKEGLSLEDWLVQHFFSLRDKEVTIEVYNYNSINQKNVVKNNQERDCGNIKIYNKHNDTSSILFNFVKQLNEGKDIDNLSKAISNFVKQGDSFEKLKSCIENNLQKPIIEKLSDFKETEFFGGQEKYKESLQFAFDNLMQDIKKIYEESYTQAYQEVVNFFFSIVNIFDIKKIVSKGNLAFLAIDTLFEGGKTLGNISEWADSKYSFAISHSIIKLFVQDIAPIILLFENRILNYTLIIDNKILIELSGFKHDTEESSAYIKQNLALLIELKQESLTNVEGINVSCVYENEKLHICGKDNITNHLSAQMASNNNRLVFIESPYFNSSQLVQLMKNEQKSEIKAPSAQGYNYLIISNAPYKYNAGLHHKLLEELGNAISYGDENRREVKSDTLFTNPKKDYDETIDYSKYKITIKDEITRPYVVSLSPFVFVPQEEYNDFKNAKEELDSLDYGLYPQDKTQMETYHNFERENRDRILNFYFIEHFFQQKNNKAYFLKQEEQDFKESITCLQSYINGITQVLVTRTLYGDDEISRQEKRFESKKDYSVLEMLLLTLTYYVIKNFYTSIKTDTQKWWNFISEYECIEIDKESLRILPYESFLVLEYSESKIPLCFSKQRKKELLKNNGEVFCVEEFVAELENQQEDTDEINVDEILEEFFNEEDSNSQSESESLGEIHQGSLENLKTLETKLQDLEKDLQKEQANTRLKASESLQVIIEHFIVSFFPFASLFFNLSPFNISKTLVKLLVSYKIKHLREVLFGELGLAYLAYILYNHNIKIYTQTYEKNRTLKRKLERLKKKSFVQAVKQVQNSIVIVSQKDHIKNSKQPTIQKLQYYKNIFLKDYAKDTINSFFKSLPQAVGLNIFNQLFITHYEKSKKEFERLKVKKFSYKYHPPYVLKRHNDGVFYPMFVNNTFLSFNFINMIIGGRLSTGAFGDIDSLFYCYEDIKTTNTRNYLLNKLLAYLCLDELRGMNDALTPLNDVEFFNKRAYTKDLPARPRFLKLQHNEGEFKAPPNASEQIKANIAKFNQKMQHINGDERRRALYDEYKARESKNGTEKTSAIDAYHTAMNYLDDVYNDCFNTNLKDNTINLQKHREFLRALNTIGENNIKAMYVGIGEDNKENIKRKTKKSNQDSQQNISNNNEQSRPKIIGRLATTIIMKDGLWIG